MQVRDDRQRLPPPLAGPTRLPGRLVQLRQSLVYVGLGQPGVEILRVEPDPASPARQRLLVERAGEYRITGVAYPVTEGLPGGGQVTVESAVAREPVYKVLVISRDRSRFPRTSSGCPLAR